MKDFNVRYSSDGTPHVDLELEGHPYHTWLGWPANNPRYGPTTSVENYRVRGVKPGVRVRIDFIQNGCNTDGIHWLTALHKATLLERLKVRFLKHL